MAGISVTLEGNNIQLAFEKNDHTTAVVMDPGTAQSLILALGQMLLKIDADDDEARHVAQGLLDILNSPRDIRSSQGDH